MQISKEILTAIHVVFARTDYHSILSSLYLANGNFTHLATNLADFTTENEQRILANLSHNPLAVNVNGCHTQ